MALFNLFGKKLKGENKYFNSRSADSKEESSKETKVKSRQPLQTGSCPDKSLISERIFNKGLLVELLKLMRNHDVGASITLMANTLDSTSRKAAIMINKGYIPKRIVTYLQNINIHNIEDAIKLVRSGQSDENGFVAVNDRTAASLNLPLDCMLLGVFHHLKREFAVVLVLKTGLKDKPQFVEKVRKLIKR